jgi:hypothetical protein
VLDAAAEQSADGRGAIVLAAPLDTSGDRSRLAEESSGAALLLGVARALAAEQLPLALRFAWLGGERGEPAFGASRAAASIYAGAELVIYVNRACGLPERRDLLSHRVLRERFFRAASLSSDAASFEETDAPHAEIRAAGAARVLALDAPAGPGGACSPIPLEDALLHFVRDAADLLARGGSSGAGAGGAPREAAAG